MKKLSVVGFRFSVVSYRGLVIGITVLLWTLNFNASGQSLKYSFRQGEILDYDYIVTNKVTYPEDNPFEKILYKHRFTVDSVAAGHFWLTFHLRGIYSNGIWISGFENAVETNAVWAKNVTLLNKIYSIQINNPIRLRMDESGKILDMQGVDSLLPALEQLAIKYPGIRELNYQTYKVKFSRDFYVLLINEFFPILNGPTGDTVSLVSGKKKVSSINLWNPGPLSPDSVNEIQLMRTYEFRKNNEVYTAPFMGVRSNPLVLTWNKNRGRPTAIQYTGFPPENLIQELTMINESLSFRLLSISIVNSNLAAIPGGHVLVSGTIRNAGDNKMMVSLPGRKIMNQLVPVTLNPDGTFQLDHDLDIPAGIMAIYYTKPVVYLWVSPVNPNQVKNIHQTR
ncbi:MAG: hypothetical protein D4R64_06325 [Porphyromonadaceae bacterium]|nr:MAG: hypothetical protein D4R64_06325 [Porphyromonadaceae bacterium]